MQMDHIISVLRPSAHPYRPWRSVWMTKVLQPLNERAAVIITDNIDLIEGSAIEPLLLRLVAHVYANRVILERWVHHRLLAEPSRVVCLGGRCKALRGPKKEYCQRSPPGTLPYLVSAAAIVMPFTLTAEFNQQPVLNFLT